MEVEAIVSVKASAAEAEALILALTPAQRAQAEVALRKLYAACREFDSIPPEIFKVIGLGLLEIVVKAKSGWSLEGLADQALKGAPTVLGPHRYHVEVLVAQVQGKG